MSGWLLSSDSMSIQSSGSSSSRATMRRVDVILFNMRKIAVPVDSSTSFEDLQEEALKRACKLGIDTPDGEYAIRLEAEDGALAYSDDLVCDILELADKPTVWLGMMFEETKQEIPVCSNVFIRWITPARALDYSTISAIPSDPIAVSKHTTIKELNTIAIERVYLSMDSNEAPLKAGFEVKLFLTSCALSTTDESDTSLEDLNCTSTSFTEPLNIYVVPTSASFAYAEAPQNLWAFDCSDRGIATFQTCLKRLMSEIHKSLRAHRRLLEILFKVTHFPPALEAIHRLREENKLDPLAVAILATCFQELSLRMVPGSLIGQSVRCALQASRQVFAWIDEECHASRNEADDPEATLVRKISFEEIDKRPARLPYIPGKKVEVVEIEAAGAAEADSSESTPRKQRLIQAVVDTNCQENLRVLALSLWGRYDGVENYYVDFGGNIEHPFEDKRTPIKHRKQFDALLKSTNNSRLYQMTAPTQLDDKFNTGITISKDGFVSEYGTSEGDFKEYKKYIWNAISGIDIQDMESGQSILQALQPVIKQRKAEGTWDPDDWDYNVSETELDLSSPKEAIVICFDLSWSMDYELGHDWVGAPNGFSKLDETKQVFENVVGRMLGYQLVSNFIGVVTFSDRSKVRVTRELSRLNKQEFKNMTGDMKADGLTALWDALQKAKEMLLDFKMKFPKAKLRIIALTDGEDNSSTTQPANICKDLYDAEIVLDSIVIGSCSTKDLFKMSKHTGGYAFNPTSRLLLYQTFLLEPFLDISARPEIERIAFTDYNTFGPKEPDMQTEFDFPACRKHPLEERSFVSLSQASRFFATRSAPLVGLNRNSMLASRLLPDRSRNASTLSTAQTLVSNSRNIFDTASIQSDRSSASLGRVCLSEIRDMLANSYNYMDVYVNESTMSYWKIVMDGPEDTPYAGGTFMLTVHMTDSFPQFAPTVRFITPILHPNVTKHGRICHQIFTKGWQPSYHVRTAMQYMHDLLKNPETNDAVDELATLKFWTDEATAKKEIEKYVEHFAKKSRREWQEEILRR